MTAKQRLQIIESTRELVTRFVPQSHLLQSWENTSVSHLAIPALVEAEERSPPSREGEVEATSGEYEDRMRTHRPLGPWAAVLLVALVGLTACTYDAAVRQLSPPEQAELWLYHHRLTGLQEHTYLAKASAAERTAYLRGLGVVQRFQALDPLDQEAVRSGWPRVGMSAEALLFVWGEPYYTAGDARHSAHWHYLGSSFGRSPYGNRPWGFGNRVDVYLVDGKVVGWVDAVPSTSANGGSSGGAGR
jgi:hypothetical protein